MAHNRVSIIKGLAVAASLILFLSGCAGVSASPDAPGSASSVSPVQPTTSSPTPVATATRIVVSGQALTIEASDGREISRVLFTGDLENARATLTSIIGTDPVVTHVAKSSCNVDFDTFDWNGLAISSSGSVPFRQDKAFSVVIAGSTVGGSISLEAQDGTTVGASAAALEKTVGVIPDATGGSPGFTYDTTPVAGDDGVFSGVHVKTNAEGMVVSLRAPHLTPDYC